MRSGQSFSMLAMFGKHIFFKVWRILAKLILLALLFWLCKRDTSVLENLSNIYLQQNGVQAQDIPCECQDLRRHPEAHTCVPPGPVHDGLEGQSCKESEGWNRTQPPRGWTSKGAPKSQSHICPANLGSEEIRTIFGKKLWYSKMSSEMTSNSDQMFLQVFQAKLQI